MSKTPPHLLISYQRPIQEETIRSLADALKAPGLDLVVERRPPSGPFAGLQWLFPTAVIIWFGKSYFEGFLKEAGKEHYAVVRRGLSTLWPSFFGEDRSVRVTAVGTPGKIRSDETKNSLGISIFGEGRHGLHFKLLFLEVMSAEDFNVGTASFLRFLERYYAGELDATTELRLRAARAIGGTILVTYEQDQDIFRFLDPIPRPTDSDQ